MPHTAHFYLSATPVNESASCHQIGFESRPGEKVIFTASDEEAKMYHFGGIFKLGSILDAFHDADPIPEDKYDFLMNNCVHFASRIWRAVGAEEGNNLEDFLFEIGRAHV